MCAAVSTSSCGNNRIKSFSEATNDHRQFNSLPDCLTIYLSQFTRCLTHSLSAAGTRTPGLQHSPASFGNGPCDADFDSSVYDVSAATEVCPFHCCHLMVTIISSHYVSSPMSNLAADASCKIRILNFSADKRALTLLYLSWILCVSGRNPSANCCYCTVPTNNAELAASLQTRRSLLPLDLNHAEQA